MARGISVIVCILLLLALFIFPRQRLNTMCDTLEELAEDTVDAVLNKDFARGKENLEAMKSLYERERDFLHMLLHHDCGESLDSSISGLIRLMEVGDQPQSLMELEYVITHVRYLKTIEELHLLTLL